MTRIHAAIFASLFLIGCGHLAPNQRRSRGMGVVLDREGVVTYANRYGERIGFEVGDKLTGFEGKKAACQDIMKMALKSPDRTYTVSVDRNGQSKNIRLNTDSVSIPQDASVIEEIGTLLTCGKRVFVIPIPIQVNIAFPDVPKEWVYAKFSDLESSATKELFSAFGDWPGFQVIDRANINHLMQELYLQQTGAVDGNTINQIGKLTGANYALFLEMVRFPRGNSFVDVYKKKLVEIDTGQVLAIAEDMRSKKGRYLKR